LQFVDIINDALEDLDSSIKVISEPGSYYIDFNFTLASYLHSKRIVSKDSGSMRMYHMNYGVYNSFMLELGVRSRVPQLLFNVILHFAHA